MIHHCPRQPLGLRCPCCEHTQLVVIGQRVYVKLLTVEEMETDRKIKRALKKLKRRS